MNTDEQNQIELHKERLKLLDLLRSRLAAAASAFDPASATADKKESHENAELAKQTALTHETEVKQSETEAKYSTAFQNAQPATPPPPEPEECVGLETLPPELQRKLLDILDSRSLDAATLEITSKVPYGLGIKTNRSALYRFLKKQDSVKLAAHRDALARDAAEILQKADATDADFSRATSHLIRLRLLEATMCEKTNPSAILALTRSLDRLRAADHAERRLRLAEKKAETGGALSKSQSS
jgi:hypothetical protein